MLVKLSNGVWALGSVGFIFCFGDIVPPWDESAFAFFSSAYVQTKYELPMQNVRVWGEA
jgi:hypothetical protein